LPIRLTSTRDVLRHGKPFAGPQASLPKSEHSNDQRRAKVGRGVNIFFGPSKELGSRKGGGGGSTPLPSYDRRACLGRRSTAARESGTRRTACSAAEAVPLARKLRAETHSTGTWTRKGSSRSTARKNQFNALAISFSRNYLGVGAFMYRPPVIHVLVALISSKLGCREFCGFVSNQGNETSSWRPN
jgi:hypothetical protein